MDSARYQGRHRRPSTTTKVLAGTGVGATAAMTAIVPAAAALLALGGCATKGDVDQLRSDIAGLRSRLEAADAAATRAEASAQQAAAAAAQAQAAAQRADAATAQTDQGSPQE